MNDKTDLVYSYVRTYINENGIAPTHREIVAGTGLSSTSIVAAHIQRLVSNGKLEQISSIARGLRLVDEH